MAHKFILKLYLFQKLTFKQWAWVWSAYWRLWPVLLRIKFKQGGWLRRKISTVGSAAVRTGTHEETLYRDMHESVRLAARLHFIRTACLPRSIVLTDMLQARGHSARVLLGVSKERDSIASHAWVEVDGVMVAEPESVENDFTPIL